MHETLRNILKIGVKTARNTPILGEALKKAKQKVVERIDYERSRQEIYNLASFYPSIQEYATQQQDASFKKQPLISILLPTYNTPEEYLRECIDSISIQSYPRWELCIADDNSSDKNVVKIIKDYQARDTRIKLIERKKNGHISESTNSALSIATGEFVALMDHDDILWPNALYEMVKAINENPKVDLLYSDEDKIDGTGKIHSYPFLKPNFSPEFLESCNYITHFSCIRTSVMQKIGGFRKGYEGAQDWDLFIRIGEITDAIIHIPKILYSWRIHAASTASDTDAKPYVYEAQRKLLVDHIERTDQRGVVETGLIRQHRTIKYETGDDALDVVIDVHDTEVAERLLSSMAANDAGVTIKITYLLRDMAAVSRINELHGRMMGAAVAMTIQLKSGTTIDDLRNGESRYAAYIRDDVVMLTNNWAKLLLADVRRKGVGFVGPAAMRKSGGVFASSGVGVGYGDGLQNMLEEQPMEDSHYTRGLYARSRRNVSAVHESCFAVNRSVFDTYASGNIYQVMVDSLRTYRHVYTPYVQIELANATIGGLVAIAPDYEDRYLNPHFKHENGNMEVRY